MSLPDYLSRKSQDDIGTAQVNVGDDCEIAKCMLYKSKICATNHYKPSEYIFMIDSLMNLEESKIPLIKESSVSLAGGKLIFEYDTQVVCEKEADLKRTTFPVVAGEAAQEDAFVVGKVSTRSSVSQEAGFCLSLPSNDNLAITPRVQDDNSPTVASGLPANQKIQGDKAPAHGSTGYRQGEVSHKSSMSLGDFCDVNPHFENSLDIADYFQQNFKVIPRLRNKQPIYKRSGSKLESFYGAFEPLYFYEGKFGAELLNFNQLIQDPSMEKAFKIILMRIVKRLRSRLE